MPGTPLLAAQARTGIRIGLEAHGLSEGDAVLVPALHCAAMLTPLLAAGLVPRFYDLTADGTIDPERTLSCVHPDVRAIMVVHRFGFPENLETLASACRERGLVLLEDCTHVGWCRADRSARPGHWGDLVIGSGYKFSAAYEGGFLWSRGVELPRLRSASLSERLRDAYRVAEDSWAARRGGPWSPLLSLLVRTRHRGGRPAPGTSDGPPPDISALLALYPVPLRSATPLAKRLMKQKPDRAAADRRSAYRFLQDALAVRTDIEIPTLVEDCVPYMLPLTIPEADPVYFRLRQNGFGAQRFGLPVWPDCPLDEFPNARRIALHGLQLPIHSAVDRRDLQAMVDLI
jgi:dTDP-4-amino-4,6-dideoxygalactose transaminase